MKDASIKYTTQEYLTPYQIAILLAFLVLCFVIVAIAACLMCITALIYYMIQ